MEKSALPAKTDRIHQTCFHTYGNPSYEMTEAENQVRHLWRLWSKMLTGLKSVDLGDPIVKPYNDEVEFL